MFYVVVLILVSILVEFLLIKLALSLLAWIMKLMPYIFLSATIFIQNWFNFT